MKDEMIVKQDFQWDKLMDIIEAGIKIPKVIKVKESNKTPGNLGKDRTDGDMFACYIGKSILIHKGNLNDGTY